MLQFVLLFMLVVSSDGARRDLKPVDTFSMISFLKVFRASLLDLIASEWNVTISNTEELQRQMSACIPQIQSEVSRCENCTKKVCKKQPALMVFLHQIDPTDALKQPLTDVGSSLDNVVQLLGTKSFGFLDAMKGITNAGLDSVGDGLESAVVGLGHGLNDLGKLTIDGLGNLGKYTIHGITDIGQSIGDGFKHAGESIAHGISNIFGKRKRYLDSVDIECMNRCDNDCWKLMTNNNTEMLSYVCGNSIVALNATIRNTIGRITTLYNTTLDVSTPIVSKIEIDTNMINSMMEVSVVYVTSYINGNQVRYKSIVPYKMMDIHDTANQMAKELWNRWG